MNSITVTFFVESSLILKDPEVSVFPLLTHSIFAQPWFLLSLLSSLSQEAFSSSRTEAVVDVCVLLPPPRHFADLEFKKMDEYDMQEWDFHGGSVVKTSPSNAESVGSIPDGGAKIPHALWP